MLSEYYGKKYKLSNSEKFEEYMKVLGVSRIARKLNNTVSPVIKLTENDGLYTLKSTSPFKTTAISFKLGEEFEEETPDGRKSKSIITQEGNKLIQIQKGEKETSIIREFTPDFCNMTMTVEDIVCKRIYKAES